MTKLLRRHFTSLLIAGFLTIPAGGVAGAQDSAAAATPPPPSAPPAPTADTPLTLETLELWHNFIQPNSDELRWQDIPWRASLWQAVVDAQAQRRPVLLWTMNGHPMGCT